MGFEVEFLPVGDRYRSGDAVLVRWGQPGAYQVIVVDGGTTDSGAQVVARVQQRFGTRRVDHVVCTHPDGDHSSGLATVLRELQVGQLWLHRPWAYSALIADCLQPRPPRGANAARLRRRMRSAYELEAVAIAQGVRVHEPFQGARIGAFWVLSPPRDWYVQQLVPAFERAPQEALQRRQLHAMAGRLATLLADPDEQVRAPILESWHMELLAESVRTSPENESSTVLFADFAGQGVLLTADAGIHALAHAADMAAYNHVHLPSRLKLVQVPQHGGRENVSPSLLDRLLGPRKPHDDGRCTKRAFVSAGTGSTRHPHPMVVNAFLRRGARPYATQGQPLVYRHGMPGGEPELPEPLAFAALVGLK